MPRSTALVAALPAARSSAALSGPALPPLIVQAGASTAFHTVEFFAARISNANTRSTYGRAVGDFCRWCETHGLSLPALTSLVVAGYFAELRERLSPASANVQLSAIRQWLEWLTLRGILPFNPAACVRGVRLARTEGKTPILDRGQARRLFASFEGATDVVSLRDRAIVALMLYGFVRVGAVVRIRVRDFQDQGDRAWIVLHEKGGKQRRLPVHHVVRQYVNEYLECAGLNMLEHARAPLFQSAPRSTKRLSGLAMDRSAVLGMVKRRCRAAQLPDVICNHSFRATGITLYQENGGSIEAAAYLAGHSDPRTTRLYSRVRREPQHADVERVRF